MKIREVFLIAIASFSPLVIAEMYKCGRTDGSTALQNLPCDSGERTISIDGVPYAAIQRRAQENQQIEAEKLAREASERERIAAAAAVVAKQRSVASPLQPPYDHSLSAGDRRYQESLSRHDRASKAEKDALARSEAQNLRNSGVGISDKQMRGLHSLEAELMRR
jgi:hypothetical protein